MATLSGCSCTQGLELSGTEPVVADEICTAEADADRRSAYIISSKTVPLT
jgi:hypothetical protein